MAGKAAKHSSYSGASGTREAPICSHSAGMGSANGPWRHKLHFALSDLLLVQKCPGIKLLRKQKQVHHQVLEKFYLKLIRVWCSWVTSLLAAPSTVHLDPWTAVFMAAAAGYTQCGFPFCHIQLYLGPFVVCLLVIALVPDIFHVK